MKSFTQNDSLKIILFFTFWSVNRSRRVIIFSKYNSLNSFVSSKPGANGIKKIPASFPFGAQFSSVFDGKLA